MNLMVDLRRMPVKRTSGASRRPWSTFTCLQASSSFKHHLELGVTTESSRSKPSSNTGFPNRVLPLLDSSEVFPKCPPARQRVQDLLQLRPLASCKRFRSCRPFARTQKQESRRFAEPGQRRCDLQCKKEFQLAPRAQASGVFFLPGRRRGPPFKRRASRK